MALADDAIVAFAIHGEDWLHHLYVSGNQEKVPDVRYQWTRS